VNSIQGKILIAGATGYLGRHVLAELKSRNLSAVALVRTASQAKSLEGEGFEARIGQVTSPDTLRDVFEGVEVVFSSIGITRQKDGLTYDDVDYQGNLNLLRAAKAVGVRKFVYTSVYRGDEFRHVKIIDAKERFVDALRAEAIEGCVVRPTGFFSDMADFFSMAKQGRVFLFGNGEAKLNPIAGEDLAKVCADSLFDNSLEVNVGGPQTYTQNDIARLAFKVLGTRPVITHIPMRVAKFLLGFSKLFVKQTDYGPIEMYMTVSDHSMAAPEYGVRTLEDHFLSIKNDAEK